MLNCRKRGLQVWQNGPLKSSQASRSIYSVLACSLQWIGQWSRSARGMSPATLEATVEYFGRRDTRNTRCASARGLVFLHVVRAGMSPTHACSLCVQEYRADFEGQPWVQELQEKMIKHSANLEVLSRMASKAAAKKKKRARGDEDNDSECTTPAASLQSSPQKRAGAAAAGGAAADDDDDAPSSHAAGRTPPRDRSSRRGKA